MGYFRQLSDNHIDTLKLLQPTVDDLLLAHFNGDYQLFEKWTSDDVRELATKEGSAFAYLNIQPQMGRCLSKRFIGALNQGGDVTLLYIAQYALCGDEILLQCRFNNNIHPIRVNAMVIQ